LSHTSCTFVKLKLREQGTQLFGDAGEFDKHFGINLEPMVISKRLRYWLYYRNDDFNVGV